MVAIDIATDWLKMSFTVFGFPIGFVRVSFSCSQESATTTAEWTSQLLLSPPNPPPLPYHFKAVIGFKV